MSHTAAVSDAVARFCDTAPLETTWELEDATNLVQATFVIRRFLNCRIDVARDAAKTLREEFDACRHEWSALK